jgi:prolyl oligopeptidase
VLDYVNGKVYVITNYKAPNRQLIAIDPLKPQAENWQTVIAETNSVLEQVYMAGGKLITKYIENASNHVYVHDFAGKKLYEVKLPTVGTVSAISGSPKEKDLYYSFVSFTYPTTIYKMNVETDATELLRKAEVKFNPADYVTEQKFYTSKDGTHVPLFITYKKGIQLNGKNPLMLYGYGGFNISLNPSFNTGRIPFIENGGIYVVANIRGGGEYGEKWHLAGTKMQKLNVFNDFIAAAEYLIANKYTNRSKIAINGGSNGGLLVGACMTLRPDLFAVAIPEVGVLDMLRYQKFTIGWAWASDYGTSDDSKEMFDYLYAYSPLHNVKAGVKYPATMVMTGDHDDRVVPAHSFKFAATLQAKNKGNYVSLIRIDEKAGHGAGKPIAKVIDAQGDMWAFVMYNLGMKMN